MGLKTKNISSNYGLDLESNTCISISERDNAVLENGWVITEWKVKSPVIPCVWHTAEGVHAASWGRATILVHRSAYFMQTSRASLSLLGNVNFRSNTIKTKQCFQLSMVTIQEHMVLIKKRKTKQTPTTKRSKTSFGIQECASILGCVDLLTTTSPRKKCPPFWTPVRLDVHPSVRACFHSLETLKNILEIGALIKRYKMSQCLDFNTLTQCPLYR